MLAFRHVTVFTFALLIQGGSVLAADPAADRRLESRRGRAHPVTIACGAAGPCRDQAGPGPADRAVHPFEGSLGRPCGYRWRATPEGTRKVRVCF